MNRTLVLLAVGMAGLAAAGCNKSLKDAPQVHNACYHVAPQRDGAIKFYKIHDDDKSMYECAAQLDEIRFRFMSLGSNRDKITGLYNGTYLFLGPDCLSTATDYDAGRFAASPRLPDGRLANLPGNIPQPGPTGGAITITQNPNDQRNIQGARGARK